MNILHFERPFRIFFFKFVLNFSLFSNYLFLYIFLEKENLQKIDDDDSQYRLDDDQSNYDDDFSGSGRPTDEQPSAVDASAISNATGPAGGTMT